MPELKSDDSIRSLTDNESLLDVMLQVEDYLDSLDLYAFANWVEGTIVEGPFIQRYWVNLALTYPYEEMPDPRGGERLLKFGTKVKYKKIKQETAVEIKDKSNLDGNGRPKMEDKLIWIVYLKIPRRFIEEIGLWDLEDSEENIDIEDIEDAQDEGVDEESGITNDEDEDDNMDDSFEEDDFEL